MELSSKTRAILALAEAEAKRMGHLHIFFEHFLLAILIHGKSATAEALTELGMSESLLRVELPTHHPQGVAGGSVTVHSRLQDILQLGCDDASQRRHEEICPAHVIVGALPVTAFWQCSTPSIKMLWRHRRDALREKLADWLNKKT